MGYSDTPERAVKFATSALEKIKELELPANPNNFCVWYNYFAGSSLDLSKAIDDAAKKGRTITEAATVRLYDRYLDTGGQAVAMDKASGRLETELNNIMEFIGEAGDGAAAYSDVLDEVSGEIGKGAGGAEAMVAKVLTATRLIEEQNKALESKLKESASEVSQLKDDLEDMRHEALTDGLTQIPNRKVFDTVLRREMLESNENEDELCLLMLDIDHFKRFNDDFGHLVGDQVLKLLARNLTNSIKGQDTAARYGGEEFSVILPRTGMEGAVKLAEVIRKQIRGRKIVDRVKNRDMGRITISIGVGLHRKGEPVDELIKRADQAMYFAKNNGRDRVATEIEAKDVMLAANG